jgi:hypothetical protein
MRNTLVKSQGIEGKDVNNLVGEVGPAHPDMPLDFIKFITVLWKRHNADGRRTFSREIIKDRKVYFDRILSNNDLAKFVASKYKSVPAQKALHAMVREAVYIPERWQSDDKRSWGDKETYLHIFDDILQDLELLLNIETMGPASIETNGKFVPVWIEFRSRAMARAARSKVGRSNLLEALSNREVSQPDRARAFEENPKPIPGSNPTKWRSQPMRGNLLTDLRSNVISASQWDRVDGAGALVDSLSSRYVLSIYDFQKIVRAFRQPLERYIDRLWKEHDHGLTEGHAVLRYTAHALDKALDRFAAGFSSKTVNFSRDSAISCFIGALYSEHYIKEAFEPRRVNAWCRARRNSHPPRPTSARP